jgi:hypothetical protein
MPVAPATQEMKISRDLGSRQKVLETTISTNKSQAFSDPSYTEI